MANSHSNTTVHVASAEGLESKVFTPQGGTLLIDGDVSVVAARLLPDGTLQITLSNDAVISIAEYSDNLPQIVLANGQIVSVDTLLQQAGYADAQPTQDMIIELSAGETVALNASLADFSDVKEVDGALTLTLNDGSRIIIPNYEQAVIADASTAVALNDGVVLNGSDIFGVLLSAASLNDIETAAGEASGGAAGHGYGFQSVFSAEQFLSLNPIGAINPTELAYDVSDREPRREDDDLTASGNGFDVADKIMKEDTPSVIDLTVSPNNPTQSVNVTIGGFTPGWAVDTSQSGGTYDPATGTWTITLPPGQSLQQGPTVTPPHNSDADLTGLVVTTTLTNADGTQQQFTDTFDIVVDAVADTPDITVANVPDQYWYVKDTGYHVALHVDTGVTDRDGSEILSHVTIDLNQPFTSPAGDFTTLASMGVTLNMGTEVSPGVWQIDINAMDGDAALNGLELVVPNDQNYQAIHQSITGGHQVYIPVTSYVVETNLNGLEPNLLDNTSQGSDNGEFKFYITPLVLDLDGDGVELVGHEAGVTFDMNNDGIRDTTTWVGADDGILALDINGNSLIDNQSELFGNGDGMADGFAALAQHDSNGDGIIDASDSVFDQLTVWQDANQDGISQADEMYSLSDLGIAAINLDAQYSGQPVADGHIYLEGSFVYEDGNQGVIADALFDVEPGVIDARDVLAGNDDLPFEQAEHAAIGTAVQPAVYDTIIPDALLQA